MASPGSTPPPAAHVWKPHELHTLLCLMARHRHTARDRTALPTSLNDAIRTGIHGLDPEIPAEEVHAKVKALLKEDPVFCSILERARVPRLTRVLGRTFWRGLKKEGGEGRAVESEGEGGGAETAWGGGSQVDGGSATAVAWGGGQGEEKNVADQERDDGVAWGAGETDDTPPDSNGDRGWAWLVGGDEGTAAGRGTAKATGGVSWGGADSDGRSPTADAEAAVAWGGGETDDDTTPPAAAVAAAAEHVAWGGGD
ncbi:MAG: hypothetical protein M1832_006017 [Thelocarpon impressellum]|nr:MAG: hypothetical protein M1832_006017 [Thelocarpon impressellum]